MKNLTMTMAAICLIAGILQLPASVKADLIVTEIMYNPASKADSDWEYVEIYNTSTSETLDLAGYVLDDDDDGVLSSANISAGSVAPLSTAVLFNAADNTLADMQAAWGADINFIEVTDWSSLDNKGDRISMWDSLAAYDGKNFANAIIDVIYDDSGDWPTDNNKASIHLTDQSADPNVGTNWALSEIGDVCGGYESNPAGAGNKTNVGSPGSPPPGPLPEPGAMTMLVMGGLGLLLRHRRRRLKRLTN
ncbi:MAG: lamin tail domain-containing protein [Planctomycetota bacterium]|nr:lamin tail domain-containing protein [Planctomycetota bacterium]